LWRAVAAVCRADGAAAEKSSRVLMKRIDITPAMADALATIARVELIYVPGRDSSSVIELPKLALADATLAAVAVQQQRRVVRLPVRAKAMSAVVEVELRPKRGRG
jgi:hypothetical protein